MKEMDYDLAERTASFGEAIIEFCLDLPANPVSAPLVSQLIRAATGIGANYCEADDAESKKDFRHKVGLCPKEARETKDWLCMIAQASPQEKLAARPLWKEAKELHPIFAAIIRTTDRNLRAAKKARPPTPQPSPTATNH
jgi:four helix bundle protein